MLKMRICVYTPVGYSGSLSTVNETCNKDKGSCTKKIVGAHLTSLPTHLNRVYTCSPHLRRPVIHSEEFGCCSVHELRGTFWLSDLVYPGLSDALGLSDNENLFTVLISIHPHHVFEIIGIKRVSNSIQHIDRTRWIYPSQVSPCLSWILKFCSLTLLRWHCLIGWVSQRLLFWDSRRTRVSPFLAFNMSTWHRYSMGIYPTQVFPCSSLTVAWHSCGWWGRRALGRRRMINFLPWKCHGCWRGQAWGRTRW